MFSTQKSPRGFVFFLVDPPWRLTGEFGSMWAFWDQEHKVYSQKVFFFFFLIIFPFAGCTLFPSQTAILWEMGFMVTVYLEIINRKCHTERKWAQTWLRCLTNWNLKCRSYKWFIKSDDLGTEWYYVDKKLTINRPALTAFLFFLLHVFICYFISVCSVLFSPHLRLRSHFAQPLILLPLINTLG